jgi:hypothetical protein
MKTVIKMAGNLRYSKIFKGSVNKRFEMVDHLFACCLMDCLVDIRVSGPGWEQHSALDPVSDMVGKGFVTLSVSGRQSVRKTTSTVP